MKHLLALVLGAALGVPAVADIISLDRISVYLEALPAVEADFVQTANGSDVAGKLYIKRPGRMRFEYDGDGTMVVAGGGSLAVFDPRSNQNPTRYPLGQTPLNLILKRDVDLSSADMVVAHWETDGGFTVVRVQDPENPHYGHIDLWFSDAPLQLRQWVVSDNAGDITRMQLTQMRLGGDVPNQLFNIRRLTDEWTN